MKIKTKYFGEMEINKEDVIRFPEGLPGFQEEKEFIIINSLDKDDPFQWMQSVKNSRLSFIVINPFLLVPDYDFKLPDSTVEKLKIQDEKDVAVYSIVVVPEDIKKMTINLAGPIVINAKERLGKQIVLDDDRYSTKYYIFPQEVKSEGV